MNQAINVYYNHNSAPFARVGLLDKFIRSYLREEHIKNLVPFLLKSWDLPVKANNICHNGHRKHFVL